MASVKVKFRPSTIEGKEGTVYYQIIHNRVIRQLKTDYRIFHQWKQLDISPLSIKCHLILRKTIYGRFLPMIF